MLTGLSERLTPHSMQTVHITAPDISEQVEERGRGTWSLKGHTLNTYVEGELFASYTIISATSTVSEMKMSIGDESIWVKCKKQ